MTINKTIFLLILSLISINSFAQSLEEQLNREIAEIESSCNRREAELRSQLESLEKSLFEEQQDLQQALRRGDPVDHIYKSIDLTQGSIGSIREELRQMEGFKQERIDKAKNLYYGLKKALDDLEKKEQQEKKKQQEQKKASSNSKKQAEAQANRERFEAAQEQRRQYERELAAQKRAFEKKMEEQRKAYGNAVRAEIRAEDNSRLPRELAAVDKRAHEGYDLLDEISTPRRNQYLLENGLADRVVAEYDAKDNVIVDQTSLKLKNQITLGRLSVDEHILGDIKSFIKQHLVNDYQHPFNEWSFCQEMMEKVCSYYKIDKQKLLMGLCEPEVSNAVTQSLNRYSLTANEQMKALLDRWKTRRNIPQWSILQDGRSSKQMLSLVNIMTVCNKNILPVPVASDEKYLFYSLDNTNKIARIERKTSKMEIADGSIGYLLQQSLSNFALSDESKSPIYEISSVFKQKRNLRRYEILEDGTGKEKYTDELGKTINYNIKAPALHYMSDSTLVVYNDFSQTERTPFSRKDEDKESWGYKFAFKNLSFTPKIDITTKNEERSVKGKASGAIKVNNYSLSATEDTDGGISGKGKVGAKTGIINIEASASHNNKGKSTVEGAGEIKKYGIGAKVAAGGSFTEKEDGSWDNEYYGSLTLSAIIIEREFKSTLSHNYMRIGGESNKGLRQLPSSIQYTMLSELFAEDEKKSILTFSDKFTSDEYSHRMPMTKMDFNNIKKKALSETESMNIPDYQYVPSEFNSFESCIGN